MGLLLKIDHQSQTPLFRQIIEGICDLADRGVLQPGYRLPSSRALAGQLGLNRSTVYRAYQELWSLGYLESGQGSYTTIRNRAPIANRSASNDPGQVDWEGLSLPAPEGMHRRYWDESRHIEACRAKGIVNFVPLAPDPELLPVGDFKQCMNRVLSERGAELLSYGHTQGYAPLREFIAGYMARHGVAALPDEIMLTTGSQNAMSLILSLLLTPGDGLVLEAPTYSRGLELMRLSGAELMPVAMTESGLDLAALEEVIAARRPKLLYTIPNFHNPTGITTGQEHRERLLTLCRENGLPIIEDGFEEDLKYFGKAVLPIKSMDTTKLVIYLGTFSKVLFPGLRIGWIAADPELIKRLIPIQKARILSGNHLDQAALHRFCQKGYYEHHLRRLHRAYKARMTCALKTMERELAGMPLSWSRPVGGYTLWLKLTRPLLNEDELVAHLLKHGVGVAPGKVHFARADETPAFRISISHTGEAEIAEGIRRIAGAIAALKPGGE